MKQQTRVQLCVEQTSKICMFGRFILTHPV